MLPQIVLDAERLHQAKRYKEAAGLYDRILAQNEENPYIVAGLATCFMQDMDTVGAAITLFRYAMDLFRKKEGKVPFEVCSNLAIAYKSSGQWEKARHYAEKAVAIEENASTLSNYGQLFMETDSTGNARQALEKSVKLDPNMAIAHWNLSLTLLACAGAEDNWERAWNEYEWGAVDGGIRVPTKKPGLPDWDGTPGKKVLAFGEQGIGDEIMFASMLPDLMRDCEVILDCHGRLTNLFAKSFGLKCYGTRKNKDADWVESEQPEAMISTGSLGKFYRKKNADFPGTPYLKADPLPRDTDKFRVGISWTGGRLLQRIARRTVPLNWWQSILNVPGCEFVSLQYTDSEAEIESVERLGYSIRQFPEAKAEDYAQTARLVASCDLVISVCTSIIHLAGALGVPTWVMVPKHPAWRYQKSGRMPWYKSVRLYRQPEQSDNAWLSVVERIGLDLDDLMDKRRKMAA